MIQLSYILAEAFVFDAVRVSHDKDLEEVLNVLSRAMKVQHLPISLCCVADFNTVYVFWGNILVSHITMSKGTYSNTHSVLTVWFLKLSIGAFLLRLFQKPVHMHIIRGVLAVVSLYSTTYIAMVVFQCSPIDHFVGESLILI